MSKGLIILYYPKTLHEKAYRHFYLPYSLLSIASMLDESLYQVMILDANLQIISQASIETIISNRRLVCVGISSMVGHQIRGGLAFAKLVRSIDNSIPIVWGGPLSTMLPDLTISHPLVDIVVIGQGQITFKEVVRCLDAGGDLSKVQGIYFKHNGKVVKTPPRRFVSWKSFPQFASSYRLVDVYKYIRNDEHINSKTISYHSSQGCPFNCGFCSEVALWKHRWEGFDANYIVLDIVELIKNYGINGVKFYDAEFFVDRYRATKFAQRLLDKGIKIKWAAAVHPRNFLRLTDEQLYVLISSGLRRLLVGAESGVQSELDLVGKKITPGSIKWIAHKCSKLGIVCSFSFVTGYPGFPLEQILDTIRFANKLRQIDSEHECKIHLYAPYPGTPLYQLAISHGFIPPSTLNEWSYYDYYEKTTPWVPARMAKLVAKFNRNNYIYLNK